jgi:hypothetical protein
MRFEPAPVHTPRGGCPAGSLRSIAETRSPSRRRAGAESALPAVGEDFMMGPGQSPSNPPRATGDAGFSPRDGFPEERKKA